MSGLVTLRDYIRWAISRFNQAQLYFQHDGEGVFEEARALVLGSLHLPYEMHDKYLDCNLHNDEHVLVQAILNKRIEQRIPAAYLLGQAWFAGLLFKVDERVVVPRSPLEEIIPQHFSPWLIQSPRRILDLCTGSGYLGISCAIEFPDAEVVLADSSEQALQVADENIAMHHLSERAKSVHSDMFAQLGAQRFDLIVCKPPYLLSGAWADLPRELQHQPKPTGITKLDGFDCIEQILQQAGQYLSDKGLLVLEVGPHRSRLTERFPSVDFTWLEHSQAGTSVLALTAQQCIKC
ncbi:50S ribosomal protein L3 N(5)-glutamine methyltransferase [Pseudomonas sp. C27(2019)]|uniref:50S ribosomal protein L3 N(5)-glutamine methyltransferase n=1 Tax=Pseudomonas sp. C27(2019) TaxID=2604941 RepID=UPI00124717AC|nr:50S ribosomal protein L3 N(5)-glutamine methyltransferase [Pseudomonas sp. C27(2019)]QEY58744.1 50S ribosomal protein L3 N(5)-glutamine methyltransferase [Pseudomonas sp. C27(2019)]